MRLALELAAMAQQDRTEEHKIGAMLLAVASLSTDGFITIRRARGVWAVTVHDPRASETRQARVATGESLREALERAWALLRPPERR